MVGTLDIGLPFMAVAAGSLVGLIRGRRRRESPGPSPAEEALELDLEAFMEAFMSALGDDLHRLNAFAPRFAALFTEIGLTVLALEYTLRDKELLDRDDVQTALSKMLELARRRGALVDVLPQGNA